MNVGFQGMLDTSYDSDNHLCMICNRNRLYDNGAAWRVVILSMKTMSIDKG